MDSQSLDSCIQKTLSSLYHPFESTAATVLCQVLDVVEKTYRGDGLSYLIDFLIPAKRILQGLQQEACLQYCGLLFRHAGWPLCIHDKIVLQLASIDWRLLQPGDFYLQVVPYLRKTPRIVLKCLAHDQHNVEEVVLPEVSYTSIFTLEWLEFINSERIGASLEKCLLTCDDQLHRVPWDMIVHPEFVKAKQSTEELEEISKSFPHETKEGPTHLPIEELMVQDEEAVLEHPSISHGHTDFNILEIKSDSSSEIEGEYVELCDITLPRFGPQKGSLTQSIALNYKSQHKSHQRDKNNQIINNPNSSKCTGSFIHSHLQPPVTETIMGASVTHYNTDHALKPETIHLVDIEFGSGESSIPDCTQISIDNGTKSFQQAFSLENEALSEIQHNVIIETDNHRQRCEQPSSVPDNNSTSLSFQEERRSHFGEVTEDAQGVTNASQEPLSEDSRTHGSPEIEDGECSNQELYKICASHPNEKNDQMVPQLQDNDESPQENIDIMDSSENMDTVQGAQNIDNVQSAENTDNVSGLIEEIIDMDREEKLETNDCIEGTEYPDNVEGAEIMDIVHNVSRKIIEPHHVLPVSDEGSQSGEFIDQNVQAVSNAYDEQLHPVDIVSINGDADDLPVQTMEQAKLELPYVGHEIPPRSPQYTKRAQSPLTQLPLETLHEDTEEEQGVTSEEPAGRDVSPLDISKRGHYNDEEKTPEIHPKRNPSPLWPHSLSSPSVCRRNESQACPCRVKDVNLEVLMSGVVYLPGTRDRSGRALVIINTRNTCWLNPHCNSSELGRLLLYFYSTVRRDCRALGLTMLVDARRCSPVPALFKAIHMVQAAIPHCIHGVLLLAEKDLVLSSERPHGVQFDVLTSAKSLHKHIDVSQLPPTFNGTFPYCHQDWLTFRTKLENLQDSCRDACIFLHNAIQNMHVSSLPNKAEEASLQLTRLGQLMKAVLEDTRLVTLQTEGGAVLARLRKEESCVSLTDDYREAVDFAAELYNRVDEGVHSLVKMSNQHIQEMELVIDFEAFEERFQEVNGWIESVGERLLEECSVLEDSLEVLLQTQRHYSEFDGVACEYCRRGQELLQTMDRWQNFTSPDVQKYMVRLQKYKEKIGEFSRRLNECRSRLEKTVRLYQFFDKALADAPHALHCSSGHLDCFVHKGDILNLDVGLLRDGLL